MSAPSRLLALSLAAVFAFAPIAGEAKRHGHGHHGWMQARIAALRGWFGHAADAERRERRSTSRRSRGASPLRAAEAAALAARRRGEVEAYLRDHPAYAAAE